MRPSPDHSSDSPLPLSPGLVLSLAIPVCPGPVLLVYPGMSGSSAPLLFPLSSSAALLNIWPHSTSQLLSASADKFFWYPFRFPYCQNHLLDPLHPTLGTGEIGSFMVHGYQGETSCVSLGEVCCLVRHTMGKALEICIYYIPNAAVGMFKMMASPASHKLKALILVFRSPGHGDPGTGPAWSQVRIGGGRAAWSNTAPGRVQLLGQPLSQSNPPARWKTGLIPTPHSPAVPVGFSLRTRWLCLRGGVPLCRVGAGCAVMSAASLRVLRSHFRTLFLSQPPVEGGLGSANVSPQGGDRFRGSPGVSRPPQGVQSPGKRREGSRGRWEQGEGNPGRGQVGPCLRWRKMFRVQSSMRPAAIPGAGVPLRSGS